MTLEVTQAVEPEGELSPETNPIPAEENTGTVEATDQVDEVAGEATTPEDTSEEDKPKHKGGFQRRIEKLTREKYDTANELEQMRQQFNAMQQQQVQQQVQQSGDAFPKLEDYGYDEGQYQQAVSSWSQQQEQAKANAYRQQQQQQAHVAQQQQQAMAMREKVASAVEKHPDFLLKVQNPELPSLGDVNQVAYEAVVGSDKFSDIAYYLASNPTEIYRLGNLDPMSTLREVFKLEQKFEQTKPQPSIVPPPPPPTRISGTSEQAKDPSKMTIEEFMAWRNK